MARGLTPDEIFDRAVAEGQRRIDQSLLELVSTSFIAGFTIVFGLIGLGIVEGALPAGAHGVARLGGALAFGVGVAGALPPGTTEALATVGTESAGRELGASFARAIAGGALVSLLSFLLVSVESEGSRLALAYIVGVFLALGPFEHVVVTALHVLLGVLFGAGVGPVRFATVMSVVTAGNVVGGLGLVTVAHVTQAAGARASGG